MKVFVQWYNHDHRHSRIKFVTPQQRHTGEDIKLLKKRQRLYSKNENVSCTLVNNNEKLAT